MDLITRCIMVVDFNYTVSSCSFFLWFIFFFSCVVAYPVIERRDHQLQHDFPCWDFVEAHVHLPDLTQPLGNLAHGMNGSTKHVSTLPGFSGRFLYICYIAKSKMSKQHAIDLYTVNNMQLIRIYKALISFSVISTNSMFLDWVCIQLVVTWQVIFWIYSIYLILYHMYHFVSIISPLRVLLQYKQREAERARLDASSHWDSSKKRNVGPQNAENKNKVTHQIQ